jgi:hypothetical protein
MTTYNPDFVEFAGLSLQGKQTPAAFTFSAAAGGSDVCEVTIQAVDSQGNAIAGVFQIVVWLSDAATGLGLTATTASGTVTAKSASGTDMGALTAKKALVAQTLADGSFILEITDDAKTEFYPCASLPFTGQAVVGAVLATADYGT